MKRMLISAAVLLPLHIFAAEECNTAQCRALFVQQREASLEAQFPGKIQRKNDSIIIRAASGKVLTFKDNRVDDAEKFITYELLSVLPGLDWVLIETGHYAWSGHILVSLNSGKMIEADGNGTPIPSPDNARLMLYSYDLDAGFNSNYIAIYRINKSNAKLELLLSGDRKLSPSGQINVEDNLWGPTNPRWKDDTTITFDEERYVGEGRLQSTHILLKLINGKWQRSVTGQSSAAGSN